MLGFSYAYLNYAVLVLFTSFATGIDTAVPTTKLAIAFATFAFLSALNITPVSHPINILVGTHTMKHRNGCYGIIQKYYYIDICKML